MLKPKKAKLDEVKEPEKGYLLNCYTETREGECLFGHPSHDYKTAHLDGYAIIPIEKFRAMNEKLNTTYQGSEGRCLYCGAGVDGHHSFACPASLPPL